MPARLCSVGGARLTESRNSTSPGETTSSVWVFGYGSLIWRPDFPFAKRKPARITGWSRRFWQGSHDHRGIPEAPGRVVTLIPEPSAHCDGVAYLIDHAVFDHLDHREKNGYERNDVELMFADHTTRGVVYIAHRDNHAFLGPAPVDAIARQILTSRGPSGSNVEYLYELAVALRELDADDEHVFELEARVKLLEADGHSPAA
jgi:glutathione-specific gamma-glutamylcyclotransferase